MVAPFDFYDKLPERQSDLAVCTIAANDYALQQLEITRPAIVEYAKKCGADYIELTGNQSPSYVMYNKYRLEQVTSVYERTLYLDCDIVVSKIAPNIFSVCDEDKIYFANEWRGLKDSNATVFKGMVKERRKILNLYEEYTDSKHRIQPNAGLMFIPKSLSHRYSQPNNSYPKMWCFDQHYLILNLKEHEYNILDWRYNLEFMFHDFWDKVHNAYFIHLNGVKPKRFRLELLKRMSSGVFEKYDR